MIDQEKIKLWVDGYLAHVDEVGVEKHVNRDPKKGEEGYKFVAVDQFSHMFDISAPDLESMLDAAIADSNLVATRQYWPKLMLLRFVKDYQEETRAILRGLFDDAQPVYERLDRAHEQFDALRVRRNKKNGRTDLSYMDLRFLSLLLSLHEPRRYNAIKPSNWRDFCGFVDPAFNIPQKSTPGEQYRIYEEYIESLRAHIRTIPKIDELRRLLTEGLAFDDLEFRWMTQDVIYIGSKIFGRVKKGTIQPDNLTTEDDAAESADEDFGSETDFEIHLAHIWKSIPYFADFDLQKGSAAHGGQFPADGKFIDLLAYSKKRKMWLVLELKTEKNPDTYKAVGQVQTYMGFVQAKLSKAGDTVRGLIITGGHNKDIESAVSVIPNVGWLVYAVRIQYVDFRLSDPLGESDGFDSLFAG